MLKFEQVENYKHSIIILLRRKNLRFLRRTNLIKTRCNTYDRKFHLRKKGNKILRIVTFKLPLSEWKKLEK